MSRSCASKPKEGCYLFRKNQSQLIMKKVVALDLVLFRINVLMEMKSPFNDTLLTIEMFSG